LNSSNFYILILPLLPALLMGYLVRRPNTHLQRVMLCPIVITSVLYAYFHHYWTEPKFNVYNWGAALIGFTIMARAVEYASLPNGRLKLGEVSPGKLATPAISKGLQNGNGNTQPHAPSSRRNPFLRGCLDGVEVLCALRGIGWEHGLDLYISPTPQTTARLIKHGVLGFFGLDLLDSTLKLFPEFATPEGGSIFDPNLPPHLRYLKSTFFHFVSGFGVISGFEMIYSTTSLLFIALFGHDASSWPPVVDKPWLASSLHEFWAFRWHQLLRQTFFIGGGYPLQYIFGFNRTLSQVGLVMGTFIASGLFHSLTIYTMGKGVPHDINIFFIAQGVGLILERLWRKFTGHRVQGKWGTAWAYLCIVAGGQLCIDAFHQSGLGGGLIIPPSVSPFRRIIFPYLSRFLV